jgi:hypothetical protein
MAHHSDLDIHTSALDSSWQKILTLSEAIQQGAEKEDWQLVSAAATERHQRVTQHFARFPVGPDTADYYYSRLKAFFANEASLQKLAKNARKKAMQLNTQFHRGKIISQIYQNAAKAIS